MQARKYGFCQDGEAVPLPTVRGEILEKVVEWATKHKVRLIYFLRSTVSEIEFQCTNLSLKNNFCRMTPLPLRLTTLSRFRRTTLRLPMQTSSRLSSIRGASGILHFERNRQDVVFVTKCGLT